MIRFFVFAILLLGLLLIKNSSESEEKKTKRYVVFASVVLILQSALRHIGVGSDTYQYYLLYLDAQQYSYQELLKASLNFDFFIHRDPFFFVVCKLFDSVFHSYRLFLFFISIVYFTCLGKLFNSFLKSPENAFVSYVFYLGMFYGFFSITMLRQTLAVAFIYLAYLKLKDRRYWMFIFFSIVSILFHKSALIFILSLIVLFKIEPKKIIAVCLLMMPIVFYYRFQIAGAIMGSDESYGIYTIMDQDNLGSISMLFLYSLFLLAIIVKYRQLICLGIGDEIKMYVLSFSFLPLMWVNHTAFRISLYFSFAMFIILPLLVNLFFSSKVIGCFIISIILLFFMSFAISPNDYAFFWQEYQNGARPIIDPTFNDLF